MALFSKETTALDPSIAAIAIGSSTSDSKRVGKIQSALLQALRSDEQLIAVSADARNWGSSVMVVTSQRILYGSGSHIEYVIEGKRVARSAIKRAPTGNSREPFRFGATVTWVGNPLKHQNVKNFYLSNDFLAIWRSDYDEINDLCVRIDCTFGLS